MAAYDYRCRTCESTFEVRREISSPADDVRCPQGHGEVSRVWSAVAVLGRSGGSAPAAAASPAAGGCCGGGCCS